MRKLETPLGILLTVALLMIYAAYSFVAAAIEHSWVLIPVGIVSVIASIGTARLEPWSRFLVYALTSGFIAKLGHSIQASAAAGYFSYRFDSPWNAALSLVPELLLALLSGACCLIVHRHFRSNRAARNGADAP